MARSCSTMLAVSFVSDWVYFLPHCHVHACHNYLSWHHSHQNPCGRTRTPDTPLAPMFKYLHLRPHCSSMCKHGYCRWRSLKTLAFRNQTFNQPHPWTVWSKTWLKWCFTSTETVGFLGTGSPGRPLWFSHSSWAQNKQSHALPHFFFFLLLYVHRDHKD